MSRIGRKIVEIPDKVEVSLTDDKDGFRVLKVKGPMGESVRAFRREIQIVVDGKEIKLDPREDSLFAKALWGTYGSHVKNMIDGALGGFKKNLQIEGVGFKAAVSGDKMTLNLGFSHPVEVKVPVGIKVSVEKGAIHISGADKELVGKFASQLVALKRPEPYKGKGIRYEGQVIKLKQGKKSVT
ncbi:MAG: 50S ribosomal protein L6 [Candidatus Paceibacterota bacterium]|jgi:large subunit ribosomal protein L6